MQKNKMEEITKKSTHTLTQQTKERPSESKEQEEKCEEKSRFRDGF